MRDKESYEGQSHLPEPLVRRFTLDEFEEMVNLFPDDQLELINGEIVMSPPPDDIHIEQTMNVADLLTDYVSEIRSVGGRVAGCLVQSTQRT